MPSERIDLTAGTVLHIKGFSSRGHSPKNKYVLILGKTSFNVVLGFLISSQLHYLKQTAFKNELVRIPDKATSFLSCESIIQCFALERLSVDNVCEGCAEGTVTLEGRLSPKYLYKIEQVVLSSQLLTQEEIDLIIKVLNLKKG